MSIKKLLNRVIIIGGGPCGLIQIKYLKDECDVLCFESRPTIGGQWNVDKLTERNHPNLQEDDFYKLYGALPGSMYDTLQGNLPKQLMIFKGHPMKSEYQNFPMRWEFDQYLNEFTEKNGLDKYIRLNSLVQKVRVLENMDEKEIKEFITDRKELLKNSRQENSKFIVQIKKTNGEDIELYYSEHIVVANGHFSVPNYPKIKGQENWDCETIHAHEWREEFWESLGGKVILIYGAKFTAQDLLLILRHKAENKAKKVIMVGDSQMIKALQKSKDWIEDIKSGSIVAIEGQVQELEQGKIAVLQNGIKTEPLDLLVYATGYKYSFPFFEPKDNIISILNERDNAFGPIYLLMVSINQPNIFFIGLTNVSTASMQIKERQAILISQYIKNQVQLPSKEEMVKDYEERINVSMKERGNTYQLFDLHPALPSHCDKTYFEQLQQISGIPMDDEFNTVLFKQLNPVLGKLLFEVQFITGKDADLNTPNDYFPKEGLF